MTVIVLDRAGVVSPFDSGNGISLYQTFELKTLSVILLTNRGFLQESWCKAINLSVVRNYFVRIRDSLSFFTQFKCRSKKNKSSHSCKKKRECPRNYVDFDSDKNSTYYLNNPPLRFKETQHGLPFLNFGNFFYNL